MLKKKVYLQLANIANKVVKVPSRNVKATTIVVKSSIWKTYWNLRKNSKLSKNIKQW